MKLLKEFKAFILKGDVIALTTAFLMATALKSIVNSIVNDVIMPIVSLLTQGTDFTNQFIALDGKSYATLKAAKDAGAATITYGNLIQALINFVIIGLIIFWIVKVYEKTKNKKELAPPAPSKEEVLLTEIRDLLKKK